MKKAPFRNPRLVVCALVVLGLSVFGDKVAAQPAVFYTASGTPGNYTLNFTVNNATPGTAGFDIYYFGVLANGTASGSPSGYNSQNYSVVHQVEAGDIPTWPFNIIWIDPTYAHLPTGNTLSGFKAGITDSTVPASIQYFAFGENGGAIYTGPGNHNIINPSNPLFLGYALPVPEPASVSIITAGGLLLLMSSRRRGRK